MKYTIGLRISDEGEAAGADESQHAEGAYDFVALGIGSVIGNFGVSQTEGRPLISNREA
ncbi:hypothetical protein CCUG60885_04526 [Mycobacteroides salmoniphilum]|uniref:Uncharacterized protein n=1 Tax=Mycobacteroides salmoniphilum TaxID=404941 RepID=A0A4R8SB18_9MYCO|nr:hypothetical protein CCUG60885_04526 [Mycobacteroides salmoniphilum]TEA08882.1 hypothetical protein CCUG60883_00561 [Mycobacteroides salmoniphilum]